MERCRSPGDPPGNRDSYTLLLTDVDDAGSALHFLAEQPEVDRKRIAVMGRSAGVHFSSILAGRTDLPAAYILTGGLHMGIDEFMELIYEEVLAYAARGPREKEWVLERMRDFCGAARHWRELLAAARRGEDYFEWSDSDKVVQKYLARLKEELEYPLYDQFRRIKKPVFICHGDKDVNVPVQEADKIFQELQGAGNPDVTLVIIPGADHSMRIGPPGLDDETRFRERTDYPYSYPFSEFFIHSVIGWLSDRFNNLQAA